MGSYDISATKDILESLRHKADTVITNPFGERVWLKQIPKGLTDCCSEFEPCAHHVKIKESKSDD